MADQASTSLVLPTAGVGGSYYDTTFTVPVYPNSPNSLISWRLLDLWNNTNVNYATTQGIAAGLVWATLTYLLTLTPNRKRTTAFHSFMLLGMIFLLIHLMIDMISSLSPGLQLYSAYTALTSDTNDSVWTSRLVATFIASQATAWIAFGCACLCLWIQAKGLMIGLKMHHPAVYRVITTYLVFTSMAALAAAMAYSIQQTMTIGRPQAEDQLSLDIDYTNRVAYLASYALCIASHSVVSMISVVGIVWKRPAVVMTGNSAYSKVLNLIGLLCAQSFIIPFIFCIILAVPQRNVIGFLHSDIMLLPSVYMILPLSSLFMSINTSPVTAPLVEVVGNPRNSASPSTNDKTPAQEAYANSDMRLTPATTGCCPSSNLIDCAHIQRELYEIDAMECGDSPGPSNRTTAETEAMLKDKDAQEKEVVTVKMVK